MDYNALVIGEHIAETRQDRMGTEAFDELFHYSNSHSVLSIVSLQIPSSTRLFFTNQLHHSWAWMLQYKLFNIFISIKFQFITTGFRCDLSFDFNIDTGNSISYFIVILIWLWQDWRLVIKQPNTPPILRIVGFYYFSFWMAICVSMSLSHNCVNSHPSCMCSRVRQYDSFLTNMMSLYSRVQNVLFSDNEQHEQEKQSRVWHSSF